MHPQLPSTLLLKLGRNWLLFILASSKRTPAPGLEIISVSPAPAPQHCSFCLLFQVLAVSLLPGPRGEIHSGGGHPQHREQGVPRGDVRGAVHHGCLPAGPGPHCPHLQRGHARPLGPGHWRWADWRLFLVKSINAECFCFFCFFVLLKIFKWLFKFL